MPALLHLLLIADVGDDEHRHIGDEAMLEANLAALRTRIPGVTCTVMARNPAWTATRFGVEAVPLFGFRRDTSDVQRRTMLAALVQGARGGEPQNTTLEAIKGTDGIVLSGGGNLSSAWPDLLWERVALLELARHLDKPAVVLGQTLGPRLLPDDRALLAAAFSSARFIGLREIPSLALALGLEIPPERIWYQTDDALFLAPPTPALATTPTIAVTIDPQIRANGIALFEALAAQLRELSQTTGAVLTLIPHAFGSETTQLSDLTEARLLANHIGLASTIVVGDRRPDSSDTGGESDASGGPDAQEVARITGTAAMVISSRYHPIVFGLSAGVPSLGIYGDEYCRIKLQGVLAHTDLGQWTLTYEAVLRGELLVDALELWRQRDEVRRDIEARHRTWRDEVQLRWAAVLHALDHGEEPGVDGATPFGRPRQQLETAVLFAIEARRQAWQSEQESHQRLRASLDHAQSYARWLERELTPWRSIRRWGGALLRGLRLRKR